MRTMNVFLPFVILFAVAEAAGVAESSRKIATETLDPQPIEIRLDQLPPPFHTESVRKGPRVLPPSPDYRLKVPDGFEVSVFAQDLDGPRWLALTPDGDVLVTETRMNRIRLLRDTTGDGFADHSHPFATDKQGVNMPFGMAFANGWFYLGNSGAVLRYPFQAGQEAVTGTGEVLLDLPGGGYNQHWTRNLAISPDSSQLFVSVGSETNVDVEPLPRASIQVISLETGEARTFSHGLRNPVGMDFHPESDELYTVVNERDHLGDDLVPDFFTRVRAGDFFGWPFTYLRPDLLDPRRTEGGRSESPELAARTRTPDLLFQAHSSPLGLQFARGENFSDRYRSGAFVAFRGSWNRNEGTGFKIVFIPFGPDHRPLGYYEDFLTGFLLNARALTVWGRPVGLLFLPDGSLLFTDESNNRVYRVAFGSAGS
jgi:glucose/arabinose dehydrogenase